MKILKLNDMCPRADDIFKGCEYASNVRDPDGILLSSYDMHGYPVGENLRAVARAGEGADNIPVAECSEKGVVVFHTPEAGANAVKELVLCELLLCARRVHEAVISLQEHGNAEAEVSAFRGCEIAGKTLGLIGLNAVGAAVAEAAADLGMTVICYDHARRAPLPCPAGKRVSYTTALSELLGTSDFIALLPPLNRSARGMFDKKALEACKNGVCILNNAHGETVDNADMLAAIHAGKVAHYLTNFPCAELCGQSNVTCLPRLGANTPEAERDSAYMAGRQLFDYLVNGNITNSINYPSAVLPRAGASRVCVHHRNIGEIVSKILSVVSAQGVKIAHMCDSGKGDYAYLMLDLERALSAPGIELISSIEGVLRVRVI